MISIIIPVYKSSKYIKKCIQSVLNNTYKNFEIIIIDDESTDNSISIIKEINNYKIKVFSQKKSGPGAARNLGIKKSIGEYIFFLDSDDVINENTLELLIDGIKDNDIIIGNYKIHYDNGVIEKFITPIDSKFNMFFESVTIWNRLYKKSFIIDNDISFEKIYQGEDRLFLANLYIHNPKVITIDDFIYNWLRHDTAEISTLTHLKDNSYFEGQVECMIKFKDILFEKINKKEQDLLLDHLRYSCFYLMDILKNTDVSKCNIDKFNYFISSIKFEENMELYKKIFNK